MVDCLPAVHHRRLTDLMYPAAGLVVLPARQGRSALAGCGTAACAGLLARTCSRVLSEVAAACHCLVLSQAQATRNSSESLAAHCGTAAAEQGRSCCSAGACTADAAGQCRTVCAALLAVGGNAAGGAEAAARAAFAHPTAAEETAGQHAPL